ncbi:MAG: 2-amino-4-oxopentanoate thiolase subunit OrtB [Candidatus Izemoplasmatales bacterium]|uniref:PLP-dependent lyase/thiolase n=1 Tax=Hujiaoplasma nucleasis TaxID=2725268 RepID=A0A7L6N431_9MOLU|nr:2-amino-4-oxopentanoate thiolase subunit OrtB [Hujiaoplasma nucleasis]QLY39329.1 PLP-dependent lyase/thiolase [Hujiaoplasma nucleasis]
MNNSYEAVMARKNDIMRKSVGIDYEKYEHDYIAFDYEKMLDDCGFSLEEIKKIQSESGVGNTPLKECKNITNLCRKVSKPGYGARIFIKDEALNDSGSFKARRASISCYQAKKMGYKGVIAATSGNYGAAVASQAAKYGLKCIIVQECYDSKGIGQPEIIEKARACEAYGAEVVQLSVGPELFYKFLLLLEETGYFNASLYTPYGIKGIESLGAELVEDCLRITNKEPDMVVVTNAGGGNLTGTARGIKQVTDKKINIVGSSVNLYGLHMASDTDFNKKSFTTGHTGFGIPFIMNPDRSDVPRSAARALRYIDRYVTVTQGEVFFITEALSVLEGIERGPAGNTSLAAAFSLAQELPEDKIIVVQETEYTSAGKHHQAQLAFARDNGICIYFGDPKNEIPGKSIVFPKEVSYIKAQDLDLTEIKYKYIMNHIKNLNKISQKDLKFLVDETNTSMDYLKKILDQNKIEVEA